MPQERLPMRKIRDKLRFKASDLSKRKIAAINDKPVGATCVDRTSVGARVSASTGCRLCATCGSLMGLGAWGSIIGARRANASVIS